MSVCNAGEATVARDTLVDRGADAITKAEFLAGMDKLGQLVQTSFANLQGTIAASQWWITGIGLGGLATTTAILLALD